MALETSITGPLILRIPSSTEILVSSVGQSHNAPRLRYFVSAGHRYA